MQGVRCGVHTSASSRRSDVGCSVKGAGVGCGVRGVGCRMQGVRCRVKGVECGCRV